MMEDKEGVSGLTLLTVRRQLRLSRKVGYELVNIKIGYLATFTTFN